MPELDVPLPFEVFLTCGCTPMQHCDRHTLMKQELARRYGSSAKSSTADEKASHPGSSLRPAGTDGPR
jgi:hypothetical protein